MGDVQAPALGKHNVNTLKHLHSLLPRYRLGDPGYKNLNRLPSTHGQGVLFFKIEQQFTEHKCILSCRTGEYTFLLSLWAATVVLGMGDITAKTASRGPSPSSGVRPFATALLTDQC